MLFLWNMIHLRVYDSSDHIMGSAHFFPHACLAQCSPLVWRAPLNCVEILGQSGLALIKICVPYVSDNPRHICYNLLHPYFRSCLTNGDFLIIRYNPIRYTIIDIETRRTSRTKKKHYNKELIISNLSSHLPPLSFVTVIWMRHIWRWLQHGDRD